MDFGPIIKARRVLDPLWRQSQLRGRCWGPKSKENPYSATNITFAIQDQLVSISQTDEGELRIHEFRKANNTSLGAKVKKLFREAGI